MAVSHRTDHAAAADARVAQQYRGALDAGLPGVRDLARAFSNPAQAVEDALWDLLTKWGLDATGARLDQTGALVDEAREGDNDSDYLARIRAKIVLLRSSGSYQQMLDIMGTLTGNADLVYYILGYLGDFLLFVGEVAVNHVRLVQRFLRHGRAAGVGGQVVYDLVAPADALIFDDASAPYSPGKPLDDASAPNPATSGAIAGVVL